MSNDHRVAHQPSPGIDPHRVSASLPSLRPDLGWDVVTPPDDMPTRSNSVDFDRSECETLLAEQQVGRVAWNAADGPQILPVNFALHAGAVVFRTTPYGPLAPLARRTPVAFEVDHIDTEAQSGWSVVVRGFAEAITLDHDLVKLWSSEAVVPWASGSRTLFIAIQPRSITGRSVQAG